MNNANSSTVSRDPATVSLVDGRLLQCNGALRLPRWLSVTQARDVCEAFGLDFEATDASVAIVPAALDGRPGVATASLAAWIGAQGGAA